jgi:hypothetical protein
LPNPVSLVEIGGHQLGWQYIGLTPLAEQPGDAHGFLAESEF